MSPLPSTTLNVVNIEINDHLNIIDTPGLVDAGSILNQVDEKMVKRISPKKEIKPRTYQLRKNQSIIIEDLIRIDLNSKWNQNYLKHDIEYRDSGVVWKDSDNASDDDCAFSARLAISLTFTLQELSISVQAQHTNIKDIFLDNCFTTCEDNSNSRYYQPNRFRISSAILLYCVSSAK